MMSPMKKKDQSKRKKFIEFKKNYRLSHPIYNYVHSMFPLTHGLFGFGFISGFLWVGFFDGPMVLLCMLVSGGVGYLIIYQSQKEFEQYKDRYGFKDQDTYQYGED